MSITDELRHFANDWDWLDYRADESARRLRAIANRIDAEHQKAIHELNGLADASVLLPRDADSEPIHIGDVMESKGSDFLFDEDSFEVRSMRCDECGWEVYDRLGDRYAPSLLRHYHAPTVEDVLREVLFKAHIYDKREMELLPDLIAEYAAKLQLKEDV